MPTGEREKRHVYSLRKPFELEELLQAIEKLNHLKQRLPPLCLFLGAQTRYGEDRLEKKKNKKE